MFNIVVLISYEARDEHKTNFSQCAYECFPTYVHVLLHDGRATLSRPLSQDERRTGDLCRMTSLVLCGRLTMTVMACGFSRAAFPTDRDNGYSYYRVDC